MCGIDFTWRFTALTVVWLLFGNFGLGQIICLRYVFALLANYKHIVIIIETFGQV